MTPGTSVTVACFSGVRLREGSARPLLRDDNAAKNKCRSKKPAGDRADFQLHKLSKFGRRQALLYTGMRCAGISGSVSPLVTKMSPFAAAALLSGEGIRNVHVLGATMPMFDEGENWRDVLTMLSERENCMPRKREL